MNRRYFIILLLIILATVSSCKKDNDQSDPGPPDVEDKPLAKDASEIYMTNFLASWEAVDAVDGYQIDVSAGQDFNDFVPGFKQKNLGDAVRAYVFGLQALSEYYYRIRAYKGSGDNRTYGPYSNVIKVNTNGNDQLPNMDLEVWQDFGRYESPAPIGIWATPNKVSDLLVFLDPPPVTVSKTTDAVSGQFAAKIETIQPEDFFLMAGTLATGIFEPDLENPVKSLRQGVPFTSRPKAFSGYYKYLPVAEDSCKLYALLSKWDHSAQKRDTVAYAGLPPLANYPSEYTKFTFDFDYYMQGIDPDTLIMIMVSSAEGDAFIGGVGSTLYVDELRLIYE